MQVTLCESEGSNIAVLAAGTGRLECLKVLGALNYPLDYQSWAAAAKGGHLDILHYLHEKSQAGCGIYTTMYAAVGGHRDCLKFLHSMGAPWNTDTADCTAKAGKVACLAYLVENGCEVGPLTCAGAAENGQYECLRYLHEHGCQWDSETTIEAALSGHVRCMEYAVGEGCPVNECAIIAAIHMGHSACLDCLLSTGYRPEIPLVLPLLEDDEQLACICQAVSHGVAISPGSIVLAASLGDLKVVRFFRALGHPLWSSAQDPVDCPHAETWAGYVRLGPWVGDGHMLCVPPSDEQLRACWGTFRFGDLHGAPLTGRARALVRERQACAQEVVRCFHAAGWQAAGDGPGATEWAAMSQVPREVLSKIMELAEVEIYEALR
jgi:hypothetical protein